MQTENDDEYEFPSYREIWGLKIELLGLFILLMATVWQVSITDRADKYTLDAKDRIQLIANSNLLLGIQDISLALGTKDPQKKQHYLNDAFETTQEAYLKISEIDMQSKSMEEEHFSWPKLVRKAHFVAGALLVILGKYLVYSHKRKVLDKERDARYKSLFGNP